MTGDFVKQRPALIIQSHRFETRPTVTSLLVTSAEIEAPLLRVPVKPDANNGLKSPSYVMVDKIMTFYRDRVGQVIGNASGEVMLEVERALLVFLGIAK